MSADLDNVLEKEYNAEFEHAIDMVHRAMISSYIGAPPPKLRGDAERMVARIVQLGWSPPVSSASFERAKIEMMHTKEFQAGVAFSVPEEACLDFALALTKAVLRGAGIQLAE